MEQKLRQLSQSTYATSEFIRSKESETNYKGLTQNIALLSDELNGLNKTRY